jgi:opacity protein-like surface antigen
MITRWALAMMCVCALPAGALAQADRGATVSGSVSATNMESHTDVAFGGTFGYRFSRVFGMEIDVTAVPTFKAPFSNDLPIILNSASSSFAGSVTSFTRLGGFFYANAGGRVVIFTNNARVEIPTLSTRVMPYFVAGGGIASVRRTAEFTYPIPILIPASPSIVPPQLPTITQPVISSTTELALTLGGGVDVRVMKQLSVEVDLRLFRLLGYEDANLGRFGVGVRYRF